MSLALEITGKEEIMTLSGFEDLMSHIAWFVMIGVAIAVLGVVIKQWLKIKAADIVSYILAMVVIIIGTIVGCASNRLEMTGTGTYNYEIKITDEEVRHYLVENGVIDESEDTIVVKGTGNNSTD